MNTNRSYSRIATVFAVLACFCGLAFMLNAFAAPAQQDHFNVLGAVPSLTHSAVSAVDTDTAGSAPITGHYKPTRGNPQIVADVSHTKSGGTATLSCYFWHYDGSTWTFLAREDAAQSTCSKYVGDEAYRPASPPTWTVSKGANYYEIRVIETSNPGVAAVTVRPWSFGAKSE